MTVAAVLAAASPAFAHAVFVDTPRSLPADTTQALTMHVPNERGDGVWNVDVVIAMPRGWTPLGCVKKPTWNCAIGAAAGRKVVHFVKTHGAAPAEDETFHYSVRTAATAGAWAFPTLQTYNNGEVVRWIESSDSEQPAPILRTTVVPPPVNTTAPEPAPTSAPLTTPSVQSSAEATTTTGAPSVTVAPTTASTTSTTAGNSGSDGPRDTTASTLHRSTGADVAPKPAREGAARHAGTSTATRAVAGLVCVLIVAVGVAILMFMRRRANATPHAR